VQAVYALATETCSYERSAEEGDLVRITKRYEIESRPLSPSASSLKVTGEGTFVFNHALGCAEELDYKATLVRTVKDSSTTLPLSVEWRRLPPGELARLRAEEPNNLQAAIAARPGVGEDTELIGGATGKPQRIVNANAIVYGFDCAFGSWNGIRSISQFVPLFSPNQRRRLPAGEIAREGYAVGAVNVNASDYVVGAQLVFMRIKDDGQLDVNDSYMGEWMGEPAKDKPRTLTGDGSPVIGIHARRGAVIDALALVIKRQKAHESGEPSARDAHK
jgi:hypothetical protein